MPEVQSETTAEKIAEKGREARVAAGRATEAIEAERRTFQENAAQGEAAARSGFDAARDMARRGAQATRHITETGRRTGFEIADLWREAFEPMLRTQLEFSRWVDQAWRQTTGLGGFPGLGAGRPFGALSPASLLGLPPADLKETEGAYELRVELPGIGRDEIDVKIQRDLIAVAGSKLEEKREAGAAFRISERRFGRFERSFPIPPDVRREGIEATFADGLLTITLPKTPEHAPPAERIPVR